jgi:muconolactone delta-isomerase
MKFLVTIRRRDGVPIPPDAIASMMAAQEKWLEAKVDDGVFDSAYVFAQGSGGIGIVNAETAEELSELLSSAPAFVLAAIDVQPLAPVSTLGDQVRALERVLERAVP